MKLCRFRVAFTASVLLTVLLVKNCSSGCRFEYTRQPPSTTLGDCDPYLGIGSTTSIRIQLECRVKRQTGVTDQFDIRWFRENTNGVVEDLGPGNDTRSLNHLVSQYREPAFTNQQYNPSFLGKYWCQVINTTADPDQPLMRSNLFTLLAPRDYTGPTCASLQSLTTTVDNTTCADLPAQSDQTALPISDAPVPTMISIQQSPSSSPRLYVVHETSSISIQQSPSIVLTQQSPSSISLHHSPSSVSTNSETPISSTVTYVVVATVLVVLVVSVTVITVVTVPVYKRCSRKQKTAQVTSSTQSVEMRSENIQNQSPSEEPEYSNLHYFHHQRVTSPPSADYDETQEHSNNPAIYQPLNTDTRDYISMYSAISAAGKRGAPLVEVEGKLYSIVDPTRREEHVYTTPQQ